jgi:hypothetical protein
LTSFNASTYYQTEFNGNLRQDEIVILLKLVKTITEIESYGANNAILRAHLTKRLNQFEEI